MPISTEQALAAKCYTFWRPKCRLALHAYALLADIDGECSFVASARGDGDKADGIAQWHGDRRAEILKGCGIDVATADLEGQLSAMEWEMKAGWYRSVWPLLMTTETIADAVSVLVTRYEQSALPARDVARRTALAQKWAAVFAEPIT